MPMKRSTKALIIKIIISVVAAGFALVHFFLPSIVIDSVAVAILVVGVVPWLSPLFKSIEIPAVGKVEFQELEKAERQAANAGLLAPSQQQSSAPSYSFQLVAEADPNLALAGLRIELEKRLVELAELNGISTQRQGLGNLMRWLSERDVLSNQERSVLSDMVGMMNSAVHGAEVDARASAWAIDVGQRLIKSLDDRISFSRASTHGREGGT